MSVSPNLGHRGVEVRTQVLPASDSQAFAHAVRLLRAGKVIAFPTDTVYGVGAAGLNERAIQSLFSVKERPRDKAIPYLLAQTSDLALVARVIPPFAQILAERFWPGGLTLVVPASERVPKTLIAGGDSVAVRVPDHNLTRSLIDSVREPLAATSANKSGGRDPATAQEVLLALRGRVPLILDGGTTRGNTPSTVVDVTQSHPKVVRVGVISVEQIRNVLGYDVVVQVGT